MIIVLTIFVSFLLYECSSGMSPDEMTARETMQKERQIELNNLISGNHV